MRGRRFLFLTALFGGARRRRRGRGVRRVAVARRR